MAQEFQSTLPARGATRWFGRSPKQNSISIHAPRTGSDSYSNFAYARCKNFNPRPPHGERRGDSKVPDCSSIISIHAPRTGSDPCNAFGSAKGGISIHAPRTGSDAFRAFFHASL